MGGLKPIGSEKLQGMEKIKRMIEISRYNENFPSRVNEDSKNTYSVDLADGKTYSIVKEKGGYIIKETFGGIHDEYIEPIQNRKYFSSFSQALKKVNLMAKEFNTLYENEEGTSLLGEKKKFKLRLGKSKPQDTPEPAGAMPPAPEPAGAMPPAPEPAGAMPPAPEPAGAMPPAPGGDAFGDTPPAPEGDDMGGMPPAPEGDDMGDMPPAQEDDDMGDMPPAPEDDDMGDMPPAPEDDEDGSDSGEGDEESSKKDEGTSFKVIQKLTGKLAQKIRKFNNNDDMDPNDVKYIINSILSALDVDLLDEDDIEEIISRLEGDTDEDEDENDEMSKSDEDENMGDEEPMDSSDEDMPPPPESPEGGEMKEYSHYSELDEIMNLPDAINKSIGSKFSGNVHDKMQEFGEEYGMHGARKPRHEYKHLSHGTFGESKVDKILSKYFVQTKKEIINEEKKKFERQTKLDMKLQKDSNYIRTISESVQQERSALKYLENNPTSKLVGKTNQGNIIFKEGNIITKLTKNGKVI